MQNFLVIDHNKKNHVKTFPPLWDPFGEHVFVKSPSSELTIKGWGGGGGGGRSSRLLDKRGAGLPKKFFLALPAPV